MSKIKLSEKYCLTCEKSVVAEQRKEKVGWVSGFSVKEYYCPHCGLKLSKNVSLGWIVTIVVLVGLFLVGITFFT